MKPLFLALAALSLGAPAFAQDAAVGMGEFKKCKACHAIVAPDGTEVQKGGRTGPNLYGVVGRPVAGVADFDYGDALRSAGADGAVWDEASLVAYITDPTVWLREKTGDAGAKSKMSFRLRAKQADLVAYLGSVAN